LRNVILDPPDFLLGNQGFMPWGSILSTKKVMGMKSVGETEDMIYSESEYIQNHKETKEISAEGKGD